MNILGFDVGSDYGTAFLLDHLPTNPRDFSKSAEFAPFQIRYTSEDLSKLLDFGIDCVVLEPTGGYEIVLLNWLDRHGISYRLANLGRVKHYRNDLGIAKSDGTDAFILACYGFAKVDDASAWVRPIELVDLREKLMQRRSLTKIRRALIPRLRQGLQQEFPEAKDYNAKRAWGSKPIGLLRWLAGIEGKKYFVQWEKKHNETCGCGVRQFTRELGMQILDLDRKLQAIEDEIDRIVAEERFTQYRKAFAQLGFSSALSAWWLCRIYPFEQFLDEAGKPIVTKRLSREKGKPVTVHVSLSRFKCALGAGTIPNTSGIRGETKTKYRKAKRKFGEKREPEYFVVGDRFCRESFFTWSDRQVVTGTLKSPLADQLKQFYLERKNQGRPYYRIMGGLHGYAARLLFKLLVRS